MTKTSFAATAPFILFMCAIVALSNYLVQFPFNHAGLGELLTWGAFTYPVAFFVTDLANRKFGPSTARKVVFAGFVLAVIWSIWVASPRIAISSGTAFLMAQMLDVSIFDAMRKGQWWRAPLISSLIGSALDTLLFFGMAFSATFAFLDTGFGLEDGSLAFPVPLLGFGQEVPLWVSLALGDFVVKVLISLAMLLPYGVIFSGKADPQAA